MAGTYTKFNGWNIIPFPPGTGATIKGMKFTAVDNVSISQSPFTMQQQVQAWPGADYWSVDVTLTPMTRALGQAWESWLLAMRGQQNVCQLGNPLKGLPLGTPTGTPVVNGGHLATATILNISGLTANIPIAFQIGDNIQIGYRLYTIVGGSYGSDVSGHCQVEVWPSLREALNGGESIITQSPGGLFRLADGKRDWDVDDTKMWSISFKLVEAR